MSFLDGLFASTTDPDAVPKATLDANTVLIANADDTPVALTVPPSTVVGRAASGGIAALDAEALGELLELGDLDGFVTKAAYGAHSVLVATADDDPQPLTIAASRVLGRKATGDIAALTGAEVIELLGISAAQVGGQAALGQVVATHPTAADVPGMSFTVTAIGTYLVEVMGRALRNPAHATARFCMRVLNVSGTMTRVNQWGWGYDFGASAARAFGDAAGFIPPASVVPVAVNFTARVDVSALSGGSASFKVQILGQTGTVFGGAGSTSGDQVELDEGVCRVTKIA